MPGRVGIAPSNIPIKLSSTLTIPQNVPGPDQPQTIKINLGSSQFPNPGFPGNTGATNMVHKINPGYSNPAVSNLMIPTARPAFPNPQLTQSIQLNNLSNINQTSMISINNPSIQNLRPNGNIACPPQMPKSMGGLYLPIRPK